MTDESPWQGQWAAPMPIDTPATPRPDVTYLPAPHQQVGWTPPPKPGLLPLRPFTFGEILAAPYRALRKNPRPTFGASLVFQGISVVLILLVIGGVAGAGFARIDAAADSAAADEIASGVVVSTFAAALIPVAFSVIANALMQAIVALEVTRQLLGEKQRFRQLWARAKGRAWAVVGFTALFGVAFAIVITVLLVLVVAISLLGPDAAALSILLFLVLGLAVTVAAAWLGTKLAFVPSAMVVERLPLGRAIARSWTLTNGSFWRIFGTLLLVLVILNIASSIVTTPIQLAFTIGLPLAAPTGDTDALLAVTAVVTVLYLVTALVVGAIVLIIQSSTTALLYVDQRMRREGLDLDLVRFVDARQAGDATVADPFDRA